MADIHNTSWSSVEHLKQSWLNYTVGLDLEMGIFRREKVMHLMAVCLVFDFELVCLFSINLLSAG